MHMKVKIFASMVFLSIFATILSCGSSDNYSETYFIMINGKKVGKEIITEKKDIKGNLICLCEQERDLLVGPKETKQRIIKTKAVFPKGQIFPSSYSYDSSTGTSYDIKIENGKIIKTFKQEDKLSEIQSPFETGIRMLDLSIFHTIDYWFRNYDKNKGKHQKFETYLLPSANIKQISIIPANNTIPINEPIERDLKNYEIAVRDRLTIILWVDKNNRLYRMFVKGPNIDVVRSDLYDIINKKEE